MIALVVLTTGLLGVAHLFALAIHQASYARNNTMLVSVAMDQMEQIRRDYNSNLMTGQASSSLTVGNHGPVTVTVAGASGSNQGSFQYKLDWTVSSPAGQEKDVTLTAQPATQKALQNRTIQLVSHFAP